MNRTKIPAKQEDGSTKIRTLVNYLTEAMGSGTFAEGAIAFPQRGQSSDRFLA